LHISRPGIEIPNNRSDQDTLNYEYDTKLLNEGETEKNLMPLVEEFFTDKLPRIKEFERKIEYIRETNNELKLK
jgi:hypothetical protein